MATAAMPGSQTIRFVAAVGSDARTASKVASAAQRYIVSVTRVLSGNSGIWVEVMDAASFAEAARLALDCRIPLEPLVHIVMGELAEEVRRCVEQRELHARAMRLLRFVEDVITGPKVSSELANAVAVSFVTLQELDALDLMELEASCPTLLAVLRDQATQAT